MSVMLDHARRIFISGGGCAATVTSLGAALESLEFRGRESLDTFERPEENPVARGQALLPFPNRVEDGKYAFANEKLQLPLDEPERGHAIHGLTRWRVWEVLRKTEDSVKLRHELPPQRGYPFSLGLEIEYALSRAGLRVKTIATNTGKSPLPFGAGHHPYFTVGTRFVDDAILRVPANSRLELDERLIPLGRVSVEKRDLGRDLDFRKARRIGDARINACFTNLAPNDDGKTRVTLAHPDGEPEITVWMGGEHRYVQIYTGDDIPDESRRRRSLAIEPMTCAPNAFNTGDGLITLNPGESFAGEWGVAAVS